MREGRGRTPRPFNREFKLLRLFRSLIRIFLLCEVFPAVVASHKKSKGCYKSESKDICVTVLGHLNQRLLRVDIRACLRESLA